MPNALDRIDIAIVDALQNNARLSNKELAAAVGLAPSSCLERVRRLEADGIIRGFHMEADPRALGVRLQAMIAVQLRQHTDDVIESFRAHVLAQPEVISVYHLAGSEDFQVHVGLRDADHLREVVQRVFTARPEVGRMHTAVLFEHWRSQRLPCYVDLDEPGARRKRTV